MVQRTRSRTGLRRTRREQAQQAAAAAVGAQAEQQLGVEAEPAGGLEGLERQPGAAQVERRAEIADARPDAARGGRPGLAADLRRQHQPLGKAERRVAGARGLAEVDDGHSTAAGVAPAQQRPRHQGVAQGPAQHVDLAPPALRHQAGELAQLHARAGHHQRHRRAEVERAQAGEQQRAADDEDAVGAEGGQRLAQGAARAPTHEKGRDARDLVVLALGRVGGVGEQADVVAERRGARGEAVGDVPGLAAHAVGLEAEADHGDPLGRRRGEERQGAHAAARSRIP